MRANLKILYYQNQMLQIIFFFAKDLRSVGQRAAKLPSVKLLEWFDPGTTRIRADHGCTRFGCNGRIGRLFLETSNFESWQLCSPLTYRPHITCMERSKPLWKIYHQLNRLARFLRLILLSQIYLILLRGGLFCSYLYAMISHWFKSPG